MDKLAQVLVDILNKHLEVVEVSATDGGELEYMVLADEGVSLEELAGDLLWLANAMAPEGTRAVVSEVDGFKLAPASALQGEVEKR